MQSLSRRFKRFPGESQLPLVKVFQEPNSESHRVVVTYVVVSKDDPNQFIQKDFEYIGRLSKPLQEHPTYPMDHIRENSENSFKYELFSTDSPEKSVGAVCLIEWKNGMLKGDLVLPPVLMKRRLAELNCDLAR